MAALYIVLEIIGASWSNEPPCIVLPLIPRHSAEANVALFHNLPVEK